MNEPNRLLYLAGPPAAGKTSLMAALTVGVHLLARPRPVPHVALIDPVTGGHAGVELGRRRAHFSGTDALALNIAPAARAWLADPDRPGPLVLAEGDRLGYPGFLDVAAAQGYAVTLVHVTCPAGQLGARAAARGSAQNPAWAKGRATKAARLAAHAADAGWPVIRLDTGLLPAPGRAAAWLRQALPWLDGALPGRPIETVGR